MTEHHVVRPESALDPLSVRTVLRPGVEAVDCRNWLPVYHEGVRELLHTVKIRGIRVLLFEIPRPLALQLGLMGVAVQDNRAFLDAQQIPGIIGACTACGGLIRFEKEGFSECPHCRRRIELVDGSVLAP